MSGKYARERRPVRGEHAARRGRARPADQEMTGGMPAVGSSEALRGFLARLIGWKDAHAVELAVRSIDLAVNHRAELVLCGAGDMVPIARALHHRALGADRPIVVCDPRRADTPASPRSPANHASGMAALTAASGGSLCVRTCRLPRDFSVLVARLRALDDVLLVVCADEDDEASPLLVRPAPICLPPLASRADELPRVIDEYVRDAIIELSAQDTGITDTDRAWIRERAASSLTEIEKAALRLVAIGASRSVSAAAERIGMAPVSLLKWLRHRKGMTVMPTARRGGS